MPDKKRSENPIIGVISLLITLIICAYPFIPTAKTKEKTVTHNVVHQFQNIEEDIEQIQPKWDNFIPKYYFIDHEINNSIYGTPRFEQSIYVQLDLSREELEKNLIHAAWSLLKRKNAAAVWIFAYRADDVKRDGGYTAGICILAPYGDWSRAIEKHPLSSLRPKVEIAPVYFKNASRFNVTQNVIINTDNANLYKDEIETENVIAKLRKGTKAIIVNRHRDFVINDFIDIYKIRINLSKKRTITGWVLGHVLDAIQDNTDNTETKTTQRKIKRSKKK